ncbi:MAG: glycosyltransferase [Spirochaetales bacterium]|nr:glycosyltransferase [Spirochaetales bacterium]
MRICFVSTYPPIECGIASYTSYLNQVLRKLHNETFIVSQYGAQGENVFPVYWPESISLAKLIFNISTKLTPDIIHIQHEFGLFGSQRGVQVIELILRNKLVGIPVVTTLHTVYDDFGEQSKTIIRLIISESSAVIVHEQYQKQILLDFFGTQWRNKIHVIPHGVREVEEIPDAKKKLNLENKKVILLCGYFRPTKGFHRIIKIFPGIVKKEPNAVLLIAGKLRGLEFLDYQTDFFESINRSPALDNIMVLRGQFPQNTFDTILCSSDVVVFPYERSGQSGILAHCYAFHKPFVASNIIPLTESIKRSAGGLIADTDIEFTRNILKILKDRNLYATLKENSKKYVKQKVNWTNTAKKHVEIYHSVVKVPYGKAKYVYID